MKSLYLRIYATLVVVLLLFAGLSGWVFQRQIEQERGRADTVLGERMEAWAELIQRALPGPEAPVTAQGEALRDWSQRLRLPLALDSASGARLATSDTFERRSADGVRSVAVRLEDGRMLWLMRPGPLRGPGMAGRGAGRGEVPGSLAPFLPRAWPRGLGLVAVLVVLFIAVAAGAYPVVRRLTRRLEALKHGVEQFGAGELGHRVSVSGSDEVAAVATSFNVAAQRVESLVQSHRSLLANASHELRSPLARLKMAVAMFEGADAAQRPRLQREIDTNIAELDALVEEVLLASRLDVTASLAATGPVELLALAIEEGARFEAEVEGPAVTVQGDERLLRRALRNLLENARRYGGQAAVELHLESTGRWAHLRVCDRGPGVPEAMRERIFEPFFRLPGHAEQAGGVGLGLSLVRQIAERHHGRVRCDARHGGGSCFILELPAYAPA